MLRYLNTARKIIAILGMFASIVIAFAWTIFDDANIYLRLFFVGFGLVWFFVFLYFWKRNVWTKINDTDIEI